jgi:hypothetical protein
MEVRRVEETSQLFDHTIETGAVITDYRIINPIGIEIIYVLNTKDYQNIYSSIKKYFIDGTLFSVQTKTGVYKNLVIKDMPHTEVAEMYNAVGIVLVFRQAQFVSPKYGVAPAKPSNTTTVDRGTVQAKAPNSTQVANATSGTRDWGSSWRSQFGL